MRLDQCLLGLWLPLAAPHAPPERPGLTLETGSPDALCPELTRTREAVDRRLGELDVQGSAGWRARYTIGHAPEGEPRDFVRLELFDPSGRLRLSRVLPMEGDSCAIMADVIALVLDRYFRSLETERPESLPGPAPAGDATRPVVPAAPARSPAAQADPGWGFLAAELGVTTTPATPAVGLRLVSELAPELQLGVAASVALLARTASIAAGGEVESRTATVHALFAWGPRLGVARPYIGPELVMNLESAESSGLERDDSRLRARWGVGLSAGVAIPLGGPWLLSAAAAGDVLIPGAGGTFVVDGREVLEPAALQGFVGAGIGYAFSP